MLQFPSVIVLISFIFHIYVDGCYVTVDQSGDTFYRNTTNCLNFNAISYHNKDECACISGIDLNGGTFMAKNNGGGKKCFYNGTEATGCKVRFLGGKVLPFIGSSNEIVGKDLSEDGITKIKTGQPCTNLEIGEMRKWNAWRNVWDDMPDLLSMSSPSGDNGYRLMWKTNTIGLWNQHFPGYVIRISIICTIVGSETENYCLSFKVGGQQSDEKCGITTTKPPTPTTSPTISPTLTPTTSPTISPTLTPTTSPTISPTLTPTTSPTISPPLTPTKSPSTPTSLTHSTSTEISTKRPITPSPVNTTVNIETTVKTATSSPQTSPTKVSSPVHPPTDGPNKSFVGLAVGVTIAVLVTISLILCGVYKYMEIKKRKKQVIDEVFNYSRDKAAKEEMKKNRDEKPRNGKIFELERKRSQPNHYEMGNQTYECPIDIATKNPSRIDRIKNSIRKSVLGKNPTPIPRSRDNVDVESGDSRDKQFQPKQSKRSKSTSQIYDDPENIRKESTASRLSVKSDIVLALKKPFKNRHRKPSQSPPHSPPVPPPVNKNEEDIYATIPDLNLLQVPSSERKRKPVAISRPSEQFHKTLAPVPSIDSISGWSNEEFDDTDDDQDELEDIRTIKRSSKPNGQEGGLTELNENPMDDGNKTPSLSSENNRNNDDILDEFSANDKQNNSNFNENNTLRTRRLISEPAIGRSSSPAYQSLEEHRRYSESAYMSLHDTK